MFRNRFVAVFAAVLAVGSLAAVAGCDWFKASGSSERTSPFLSDLRISPSSVLCGTNFSISFRYDDPQGDIAQARVTLQRTGDSAVREENILWPETISTSIGTASFPFSFPCGSKGGIWTVKVRVEDDKSHTSNELTGEIRLNAVG